MNATTYSDLEKQIRRESTDYLQEHGTTEPSNVYDTFLRQMERPLLETMMRFTNGNQSKAAQYMGINRATLRTKLKRYGLL